MNVLSLFSGIGAFEVALDELNIEWKLDHYCEIDKYACQSYNCIHGTTNEDNLKDVTNIDYSKIGDIDLVTYGFPCQDISVAGKGAGFFDENGNITRSGLFFNAADIIRHTKPKFAIFENVKNLTGKRFKEEFETVLSTLDELGYNTYWKVLNAKNYGIPQNRERVFGISIRKDIDHGYEFPLPVELTLRLKDMLEDNVDEKFYIKKDHIERIAKWKSFQNPLDKVAGKESIMSTITTRVAESDGGGVSASAKFVCNDFENDMNVRKLLVKEATKKGYAEAEIGDSINLEQPNSKTRRGRVGKGVAQTLTCSCNQAVVEPLICASRGRNPNNPSSRKIGELTEQRIEVNTKGLSNTLTTVQKDNYVLETDFRIRKLTPRECWRLMGFRDYYFDKVKGVSNTQLYKQAGNSIVVDVLKAIFKQLQEYYPEYIKIK